MELTVVLHLKVKIKTVLKTVYNDVAFNYKHLKERLFWISRNIDIVKVRRLICNSLNWSLFSLFS